MSFGKKLLLGVAGLALVAGFVAADCAHAAPTPTLFGDTGVCDPWYPTNCYAPLARVSAGAGQFGLSIASATAPTVPDGTTAILVVPVGTNNTTSQCLIWRDDGTDPSGTVGNGLATGQPMWYYIRKSTTLSAPNPSFKVIAATGATCTVNFNYYK